MLKLIMDIWRFLGWGIGLEICFRNLCILFLYIVYYLDKDIRGIFIKFINNKILGGDNI